MEGMEWKGTEWMDKEWIRIRKANNTQSSTGSRADASPALAPADELAITRVGWRRCSASAAHYAQPTAKQLSMPRHQGGIGMTQRGRQFDDAERSRRG